MSTTAQLVGKYQRMLEDTLPSTMVSAREAYRSFLEELGQLNDAVPISYNTEQAAPLLAMDRHTLTNWLGHDIKLPREQRRFPNATKSNGKPGSRGGTWIIPPEDITDYLERRRKEAE